MKIAAALLLCTISLIGCNESKNKKLPILGERAPRTTVVNGETVVDTVYQQIPDFQFINQDSLPISSQDFENSIYVADFFFTSCPSICPTMSRNLLKVLGKYKDNPEVMLLSHSIDPRHDTPAVLKKYADKLGVTGKQWQFVRGEQEEIYSMAEHYMVFAKEDPNAPGGFEHQGWFILVDKEKRIRGAYDGTEDKQVAQLMKDMDMLLSEYE